MPKRVPINEGWVKDTIEQYRLTPKIISEFLKDKWGDYDFRVEVLVPKQRKHIDVRLIFSSIPENVTGSGQSSR